MTYRSTFCQQLPSWSWMKTSLFRSWNIKLKIEPVAQRYPCPAHLHYNGSFKLGRAADLKGTMSCRIQGESVCTSVYLSIHLSIRLSAQSLTVVTGWRRGGGPTYGWTDGRICKQIPPIFYRTSSPLGPLPKKRSSRFLPPVNLVVLFRFQGSPS